jgi:hypothetical protein
VPAGPVPLRVRAVSQTAPDLVGLADGVVDVRPFVALDARIVPQTSGGPQRGDHRLVLENQGNEQVRVLLHASDPDELLAVHLDPPVLTVGPGGSAVAAVAAVARRPVYGTAPQQRPFRVRAEGPAGNELTVPALFVQEPIAERPPSVPPPQPVARPGAVPPVRPVAAPPAGRRGVGPVGCLFLGLLWTLLVIAVLLLALLVYAAVAFDSSTRDADNIAAMAVLFAFVVLDWSLIRWIRRRARSRG